MRARAVPATNAPIIGASCALLAAAENAKVIPAANTPTVAGDTARFPTQASKRGTSVRPIAPAMIRKPTAKPIVEITPATSTEPCTTMRVTTVRMTRPSTSSATAAPRTIRASVEDNARRSPKTRAVMPTLVAASAAPKNSDAFSDSPSNEPASTPEDIGRTTPRMATSMDALPTRRNSLRSISRPTSASKIMTPISDKMRMASLGSMRPSMDGPMTMPATISPRTAGT